MNRQLSPGNTLPFFKVPLHWVVLLSTPTLIAMVFLLQGSAFGPDVFLATLLVTLVCHAALVITQRDKALETYFAIINVVWLVLLIASVKFFLWGGSPGR